MLMNVRKAQKNISIKRSETMLVKLKKDIKVSDECKKSIEEYKYKKE